MFVRLLRQEKDLVVGSTQLTATTLQGIMAQLVRWRQEERKSTGMMEPRTQDMIHQVAQEVDH